MVARQIGKVTIFLLMVGLVALPGSVYAVPPLPHAFYGEVTVNGQAAPVGTIITAEVGGEDCGTYTTSTAGKYGNPAPSNDYLIVQGTNIEAGDTIEFYVNGIKADQTATFEAGGGPTELHLTAAGDAPLAVSTDFATSVTINSATLNANLLSLAPALSVDVSFEWGATTDYGNETTPETMTSIGAFSFALSNLSPGTTYHFRAKAIVGDTTSYGSDKSLTTPIPTGFTVSNLSLSPTSVTPGETVTITAKVTNTGGTEGSYTATLKINGAAQATKEVTLAPDASTTVSFTVEAGDTAGDYAVEIDGQSTTFTVTAAGFTVSNLSLSPTSVTPGETVTITAKVTNTGGTEGSYTATLKINGAAQATKEVTLAPDASKTVSFIVEAGDTAGDYAVEIDGQGSSFTVVTTAEPQSTNRPVIIGAVAILILLILLVAVVTVRRYR